MNDLVKLRRGLDRCFSSFGRLTLVLTACALVFLILVYLMLTDQSKAGDRTYHSQQSPPLTERLLWVDVDAARRDFMFDPKVMPTVASLASRGASGTASVSGITLSLPAVKAWTTGVGFAAKDVPTDLQGIDPSLDSIFWRAHLSGRYIAFSGPPEWIRSFKDSFDESFTHDSRPPGPAANDADAHANALRFLHDNRYQILVVHYDNADMAGHEHGTLDGHYADALRRIDSYIRELLEAAPPDVTVLVIADHGMSDQGSHVESIPVVVRPPFVFAGKGINHVSDLEIDSRDIAPTLSALFGLDFPNQSEGRLASEILEAPPAEKASWEIAYASSKLHAMQSAGIEDAAALSAYRAAQAAQDGGRFLEAVSLAREVERKSNLQLREFGSKRSRLLLFPAVALGLVVCLLLLGIVHMEETEASPRFEGLGGIARGRVLGSALMLVLGTILIWFLSQRLHDVSIQKIPPFRFDFLILHWKVLGVALAFLWFALALLAQVEPAMKISSEGRAVVFGLGAVIFCSFGYPFDLWLWALLLGVGVLGWRAILFRRGRLLEAGAYGVVLFAGLLAKHMENRQTISEMIGKPWLREHFGIGACLASVAAVIFSFGFLAHEVSPDAEGNGRTRRLAICWGTVSTPAWLLFVVAIGAQLVRLMDWPWAATPVLLLIAGCLTWQIISRNREPGQCQLSLSMALLAASPIVFPPYYIPFLSVALVALCLWAKRQGAEERSSVLACAVFCVAGIIWLFLGLNGDFYPSLVDIRRRQLLDPSFQYEYLSMGRIVLLALLQLLLPTLAVVSWVGYGLKKKGATWFGTINLMHLFFWAQMVSLAVYLRYRASESNSVDWILTQIFGELFIVFVLYLTFSLAAFMTERLFHGPQTRLCDDSPAERVWARLGPSGFAPAGKSAQIISRQ